MPSRINASHILVKTETEAFGILFDIRQGMKFEDIARARSLCPSGKKGGDLGWVTPGELVPEFEKAMNDLPLHKVSQPVKSQFGWHLIEVIARKQKDDSEAFKKQQVRQFLQQRKFAEAVHNWQQHLRTDAYVNIMDKELA